MKFYFVLIPGFGCNKYIWTQYLLDKLKLLSNDIYTYTPKFYNFGHYKDDENSKNYDADLIFNLTDLNLSKHCDFILNNIKLKKNQKIILISHSIGAYYAYQFAKKYNNLVFFSIMLEPAFMGIVGKERLTDERFIKFDKEIKTNKYKIADLTKKIISGDGNSLNILINFIRHQIIKQVPINFLSFPTPTIYFRNLQIEDNETFSLKDRAIREGIYFNQIDKNFKINWFINEGHYLFQNNKVADQIIMEIQYFLNKL